MLAEKTAHNRSVYASPPLAARSAFWLGHSATLHSHAKTPPHFVGPGLCFAKPLSGLAKRRKQPERYVQLSAKKIIKSITFKQEHRSKA
jgi:hypothetical protein